ncbi:MAG: lipocalin-like domain-containing protein [Anaerolineae bacterium]
MKRWIVIGVMALAVVIFGFSLIDVASNGDIQASAVLSGGVSSGGTTGFARAIEAREWSFPQDFGAHPAFQTEWWYYTGNLRSAEGRRFGYQFTLFRRALTPEAASVPDESEWRTNQLYMVHFALSDIEGGQFYHEERFSRGAADLAGAVVDPVYRTWLEDWQVVGLNADASERRITAQMGQHPVGIDFTTQQIRPPALQGSALNGLSAKSAEPGNASYYYSLTRMPTSGTITIDGTAYTVDGTSWMDHEFSTSALDAAAQGWDWFGLQFDDGRDLMIGQIRYTDSAQQSFFGGLLVEADGSTRYLPSETITITPTGTWTSPHTGAVYPAGWDITIALSDGDPLHFTVTPQMADQELNGGGIVYWEGSVMLGGDVTGVGYTELTGYAASMTGRF